MQDLSNATILDFLQLFREQYHNHDGQLQNQVRAPNSDIHFLYYSKWLHHLDLIQVLYHNHLLHLITSLDDIEQDLYYYNEPQKVHSK